MTFGQLHSTVQNSLNAFLYKYIQHCGGLQPMMLTWILRELEIKPHRAKILLGWVTFLAHNF